MRYYVNLWRLTAGHGWTLGEHTSITAAKRDLLARAAQVKREGANVQRISPLAVCIRWSDTTSQTTIYHVERAPERHTPEAQCATCAS